MISERSNHPQRNIRNRKEFAIPVKSQQTTCNRQQDSQNARSHKTKGRWYGTLHRCIQIINISFLVSKICVLENISVQINKRFSPMIHTDIHFHILHTRNLQSSKSLFGFHPLIHYGGIIYHHIPFFFLQRQQFKHYHLKCVE